MNKVLKTFQDKDDRKIYKKDKTYTHKDEKRIAFLIDEGYLEENVVVGIDLSTGEDKTEVVEVTKEKTKPKKADKKDA